jgi:hypothetical protein
MRKRTPRPYVDRGVPGTLRYQGGQLPMVKDPEKVHLQIMTLQDIRRHNSLEPALQPTERVLLRWSESGGTGLPNPDADTRETHYDPLPPDLQEKVDEIVQASPWATLTVKWYRSTLSKQDLAGLLRVSRTQLYGDHRSALWYYRGRFESNGIHG